MNASRPPFSTVVRSIGIAGACALLGACVGNPFKEAKIDPDSAVAGDVAKMTRGHAKFPSFASIPNPPKDVRPLAQYGEDAQAVLAQGQALEAATAPGTWTLKGTDAFADKARADAGPQIAPPTPGDAEAFAKALRERATPPPPR